MFCGANWNHKSLLIGLFCSYYKDTKLMEKTKMNIEDKTKEDLTNKDLKKLIGR